MRPVSKPGFWRVARRECHWLFRDRVALLLIFGVPLFAFVVLTTVFSHPVIRGLGVTVVDEDKSDASRALVEYVAASPSLKIVDRSGTLSTAVQDIRAGKAISAIHIPPDFERDLKAERRPQVVGFYNQQFLTAAGIASSGLNDALSAAAAVAAPARLASPAPASLGTLTAETIALVNPQKNYAQFLLRALLPTIIHVVIALAAGYSVGSEFRRRDARAWLESAGGDPVVALAGKLAPLFCIFLLIMLAEPLFLEGVLQIPFRGDLPLMLAAGSLLIIAYLSVGALLQLLAGDLATGLGLAGLFCLSGIRLRRRRLSHGRHEHLCASLEHDPAAALVHVGLAGTSGAGIAGLGSRCSVRGTRRPDGALCRPRIAAHGEPQAQGLV
jgi:ABC-2 type transport system permease protein